VKTVVQSDLDFVVWGVKLYFNSDWLTD